MRLCLAVPTMRLTAVLLLSIVTFIDTHKRILYIVYYVYTILSVAYICTFPCGYILIITWKRGSILYTYMY